MLEQAANALNRQDYQTAAQLITTLLAQQPHDERVQLYWAKLQAGTNNLDRALEIYRSLLQQSVNLKILTEARQEIQQIEQIKSQIQAQALADARAGIEDNVAPGLLILEPISPEFKQIVAPRFAAIMDIDPYSAKLQLPTRSWRLYRSGTMGELEFYYNQFQQAEIPSFCVAQQDIQQLFVFKVNYFQSFYPQAEIVCTDERAELRSINFNWSEVTQIVMGMLPIFEEVVEIDKNNRTYRKPKILDYIYVCDLQLRARRSILRLCSQNYDFSDYKQLITQHRYDRTKEIDSLFSDRHILLTSRDNWNNLISQITDRVPNINTFNDFTPFADTALGFPELLQHIHPHLELLRRADSPWDRAFQLYSALAMCRAEL